MKKISSLITCFVFVVFFMSSCTHPEIFETLADYQAAASKEDTSIKDSSIVSVSSQIGNVKTNVLESTSEIQITWEHYDGADSYNIYRYDSKQDTSPVVFISSSNSYTDGSVSINESYFYKVSKTTSSVEDSTSDFTFALISNIADVFEENDSFTDVEGLTSSSPVLNASASDAVIYSCLDGNGNHVTDVDWYKYVGGKTTIFVDVQLDTSTEFESGDIKIVFYYNGGYKTPQNVAPAEVNTYSFGDYNGDETGEVEVYFKIYVDESEVSHSAEIVEEYSIELYTSL